MPSDDVRELPPGQRVVLEPVAPGVWLVLGVDVVAVLAPLFCFLIGTALGPDTNGDLSPLLLGLVFGMLVGGLGAGLALAGGWRLYRHLQR